jgi:fatty acid desaturase
VAATPDPDIGESGGAPRRRSIVETWTEVAADAGGLVRAEAALARAETAANLRVVGMQSAKMLAGLALLMLALVFLTVAVLAAIAHFIGWLPALLIVALLCVGSGLLLLRSGRNRLADQNILPERSLSRMSRDLERLSERAAPPVPAQPVVETGA